MSKIIPKEQMSAYQRWELESLADPVTSPAAPESGTVPLPTAEEIEHVHRQARQEGYDEGLREGRERGYREGRDEAAREAQSLERLLVAVREDLRNLDRDLAPKLLDLGLGIAKQMLRQALHVRPELVLPLVREAINSLPQANQHPQLFLHPRDAALVRSYLEAELAHGHWRVVEDERMEPGGCRLETANSELDATLERRWRRVLEGLGQSGDWLEPQ